MRDACFSAIQGYRNNFAIQTYEYSSHSLQVGTHEEQRSYYTSLIAKENQGLSPLMASQFLPANARHLSVASFTSQNIQLGIIKTHSSTVSSRKMAVTAVVKGDVCGGIMFYEFFYGLNNLPGG